MGAWLVGRGLGGGCILFGGGVGGVGRPWLAIAS